MAKKGNPPREEIQEKPEGTGADEINSGLFPEKANSLMKLYGISIIFRCPKTGQWFTDDVFAENYSNRTNIKLEIYKNEQSFKHRDDFH